MMLTSLVLLFLCINYAQSIDLFEQDIVLTADTLEEINGSPVKYDAAKKKTWPNATVPYTFHPSFTKDMQAAVKEAIKEFNKYTCVRFVPRTVQRGYLEFIDDTDCYARVGKRGLDKQQTSIGKGCSKKGTIIHELMHSIGFYHEQSRRDRDKYIRLIKRNIAFAYYSQFRKYPRGDADFLGEPYDLDSIMHYSNTAFGEGKTTIEAINDKNRKFGQRVGFSPIDVRQINKLYECKGVYPTPTLPPNVYATTPRPSTVKVVTKQPTMQPTTQTVKATTKSVPGGCHDIVQGCEEKARKGYCTQFWSKSIMRRDCPKSCSVC